MICTARCTATIEARKYRNCSTKSVHPEGSANTCGLEIAVEEERVNVCFRRVAPLSVHPCTDIAQTHQDKPMGTNCGRAQPALDVCGFPWFMLCA